MNYLKLGLTLVAGLLFMFACDDKDDIRLGQNYLATVVVAEADFVVLELDGANNFYTSSSLIKSSNPLELGDRLYLRYFEINYDKQPSNTTGSEDSPYVMQTLLYSEMVVYDIEPSSPEAEAAESDELLYMRPPYLVQTINNDVFLNMRFDMPSQQAQAYTFYIEEISNDTVYLNFKVDYQGSVSNIPYAHIETFEVQYDAIPQQGVMNINFNSLNYDKRSDVFLNNSTIVLDYTLD